MFVKVDVRETDLIPLLTNIKVVTEALPIGDIIICDDAGTEKLIIERKTVRDLTASIKDGRYEEQSHRLNGNELANHNIVYLIEGGVSKDRQMVFSAIFSLNYYKGFSVIRTMSLEETAFFVCNAVEKMTREGDKAPYSCKSDQSVCDYANVVKKVKKENITPQNINEIMLAQLPGISNAAAATILEKFKTVTNLVDCLTKDAACLDGLTQTNKKGQQRKLNKNCAAIIKEFLLC
jgi:ERCC4-type nuclease